MLVFTSGHHTKGLHIINYIFKAYVRDEGLV